MSPFRSKAQMRAAFSGALGPKMKADAKEWADATPSIKALPDHVKTPTGPPKPLGGMTSPKAGYPRNRRGR